MKKKLKIRFGYNPEAAPAERYWVGVGDFRKDGGFFGYGVSERAAFGNFYFKHRISEATIKIWQKTNLTKSWKFGVGDGVHKGFWAEGTTYCSAFRKFIKRYNRHEIEIDWQLEK